jgi:predicted Fe-Mo cluster-binding NifX family protein
MNLKFAFAVNTENQFEKRHFGEANKFLIYEIGNNESVFLTEESNVFKELVAEHGSKKKASAIIDFLKQKDVNALVSRQFGTNIRMVNNHFVPIIISSEQPEEVLKILSHHIRWIRDEWKTNPTNYKLFTINSGIMKSSIKE